MMNDSMNMVSEKIIFLSIFFLIFSHFGFHGNQ